MIKYTLAVILIILTGCTDTERAGPYLPECGQHVCIEFARKANLLACADGRLPKGSHFCKVLELEERIKQTEQTTWKYKKLND